MRRKECLLIELYNGHHIFLQTFLNNIDTTINNFTIIINEFNFNLIKNDVNLNNFKVIIISEKSKNNIFTLFCKLNNILKNKNFEKLIIFTCTGKLILNYFLIVHNFDTTLVIGRPEFIYGNYKHTKNVYNNIFKSFLMYIFHKSILKIIFFRATNYIVHNIEMYLFLKKYTNKNIYILPYSLNEK